jgi:FAD/FMN-containing dehydrogenase
VQPAGTRGSSPAVSTESGKKSANGEVGLLQTKLNKVLAVDAAKSTMRVGAGMTITELLKAATKNKMSVKVRRGCSVLQWATGLMEGRGGDRSPGRGGGAL